MRRKSKILSVLIAGALTLSLAGCKEAAVEVTTDPLLEEAKEVEVVKTESNSENLSADESTVTGQHDESLANEGDGDVFTDIIALSEWEKSKSKVAFSFEGEEFKLGGLVSANVSDNAGSMTFEDLALTIYGQNISFKGVEIITNGEEIYLSTNALTQLVDAFGGGDEEVTAQINSMLGDAEYIIIPPDMIKSTVSTPDILEGGNEKPAESPFGTDAQTQQEEMKKYAELIKTSVLPEISKAFSSVKGEIMYNEDGVHTLKISNDNIDSVLKAVESMIESGGIRNVLDAVATITKTTYTDVKYQEMIEELKASIDAAREGAAENKDKFMFKVQSAIDGDKANLSFECEATTTKTVTDYDSVNWEEDVGELPTKEVTENVKMSFKFELTKGAAAVTIPAKEKTIAYEELESLFGGGSDDYDYDDAYDYNDYDDYGSNGMSNSAFSSQYESYTEDNGDGTFTTHSTGYSTSESAAF